MDNQILRFFTPEGRLVPLPEIEAQQRAEQAQQQVEHAQQQLESERQKRLELEEKLRSLPPEQLNAIGISLG